MMTSPTPASACPDHACRIAPASSRGLTAIGRIVRTTVAAALASAFAFAAPALAQPALWAVKDADSTIYLLGTVHLLKPETQWRTPKLEAAFAEAQELWLELPTTDPQAMAGEMMPLVSKYGLSPDAPLSKDLTPEELKTLDEAARASGLTADQLNIFRPWLAATFISTAAISRAGFDPNSGVDSKVEAAFRQRGIKPSGFETVEQQLQVFARLTRPEELAYLRETLEEYAKAPVELEGLVKQWASADLAGIEAQMVNKMKADSPALYDALLTGRNANWTVKIQELLKGKGVIFIAVGAAHLVGQDSVVAMLKAKGIEATRVQ